MRSRGGVTGGLTISEALREFERRGYDGQFVTRPGGLMECTQCGAKVPPNDMLLRSMRRIEGVSDPADMALVGAMECPECHAKGTATLCYGPRCPAEDAEVLRRIEDLRPSHLHSELAEEDRSLVSDTGWLDRS